MKAIVFNRHSYFDLCPVESLKRFSLSKHFPVQLPPEKRFQKKFGQLLDQGDSFFNGGVECRIVVVPTDCLEICIVLKKVIPPGVYKDCVLIAVYRITITLTI